MSKEISPHTQSTSDAQLNISERGSQMSPQLLVFGGAKGGAGRSSLCALVGLALAQHGQKALLIDLNLGSANLHTLLGLMRPPHNLERWISKQDCDITSLICPTAIPSLSLISAASSILSIHDLSPEQLISMIKEMRQCEVDYILIDVGASLHPHHLDLINIASHSFCVTTPDPLSIQSSYTLYKAVIMRRVARCLKGRSWLRKLLRRATLTQDDQHATSMVELLGMLRELDMDIHREVSAQLQSLQLKLVINQALPEDESQVIHTLEKICESSLALSLSHTLTVRDHPPFRSATRKLKPLSHLESGDSIFQEISTWVETWLLKQPYMTVQEEALESIGAPSLLKYVSKSQDSLSDVFTPVMSPSMLQQPTFAQSLPSQITPPPQDTLNSGSQVGLSALQQTLQQSLQGAQDNNPSIHVHADELSGLRQAIANKEFHPDQNPRPIDAVYDSYDEAYQGPFHEAYDPEQENSFSTEGESHTDEMFFEPAPIGEVLMDDPPGHEVTSIEEEVKTPEGWYHLKTSDLAPFRPVIQTSVYREGTREIFTEESYEGIYRSHTGTEIEKRVERIHHESSQILQKVGLSGWRESQRASRRS